jgi:hypothetical protein
LSIIIKLHRLTTFVICVEAAIALVFDITARIHRAFVVSAMTSSYTSYINNMQDIIGTDAGDRGMKNLIVPGDLRKAAEILGRTTQSTVLVLSGFSCCVTQTPPTETDGPPGACAIARAALALGNQVVLVTDECNAVGFSAAATDLANNQQFRMESFPCELLEADEARLQRLIKDARLIVSCERSGPAKDGACYTMRGINMTEMGLVAPLHRLVTERTKDTLFLAIGDGGNELGMGKVFDKIANNPKISNGDKIGCVIVADHLIAASVSNWGGYALAAGAALVRAEQEEGPRNKVVLAWVDRCLPSEHGEVELLKRCVKCGCRDGVSGEKESTVDGMPLETSLQCLRDIRSEALKACEGE